MGRYLLWMVTCYFRPGEPLSIQRGDIQIPFQGISSRHQVRLYPEDRPLRSKTCAANDTVELYCPWCESLPLTATALSPGNPTERISNFSCHDFLVVLRYDQRAQLHKSSHRSASGLPSLCPEMRKRVAQGDFRLHSHQQCSNASRSVNQFLPRRPRGAYFVVSVEWCMQSWTKNSAAWFPCCLVSRFRINGSSHSDWPCARCNSLSSASCTPCRDSHADQRCLRTETFFVSNSDRQPASQAFALSNPGSAKMRDSIDFDSSSLVSCLAHWFDLLS